MAQPQRTVTEEVVCEKCKKVGHWIMYARRGRTRYYRCKACGNRRVDRIVVRLKGLSSL